VRTAPVGSAGVEGGRAIVEVPTTRVPVPTETGVLILTVVASPGLSVAVPITTAPKLEGSTETVMPPMVRRGADAYVNVAGGSLKEDAGSITVLVGS